MAGEEVCNALLPDELVETIISRVPFPSIFKARCLSKSWLAKLSPISAQHDEETKFSAERFQKELSERSKNWETFCPVLMGKEGDLVTYRQETNTWRILPSLSFLPEGFQTNLCLNINGALLYAHDDFNGEMYVAGILTRTWKKLPSPPVTESMVHWSKFVVIENMYKVILLCEQDPCESYLIQIYDSQSDSWSSKNVGNGGYFSPGITGFLSSAAYLGGYLYLVAGYDPPNLWAFNVEEGTLEERELSSSDNLDRNSWFHLVACQTELLMIVSRVSTNRSHKEFQRVLRIDRESSRLVQLAEGPRSALTLGSPYKVPVTDGRCIYFGLGEEDNRMLWYNKVRDTWDFLCAPPTSGRNGKFEWIGSSFHPGSNPFPAI